jgi:LPS-assembly lipoprotein
MIEDEMRKLAATQIVRQMARLKADIEHNEFNDDVQEQQLKDDDEEYRIRTYSSDTSGQ